jgi:hypothetical protein
MSGAPMVHHVDAQHSVRGSPCGSEEPNSIERRPFSAIDGETMAFLYGQNVRIDWRCNTFRRLSLGKSGREAPCSRGGRYRSENPEIDLSALAIAKMPFAWGSTGESQLQWFDLACRKFSRRRARRWLGLGGDPRHANQHSLFPRPCFPGGSNNIYNADVMGYHIISYLHMYMQRH